MFFKASYCRRDFGCWMTWQRGVAFAQPVGGYQLRPKLPTVLTKQLRGRNITVDKGHGSTATDPFLDGKPREAVNRLARPARTAGSTQARPERRKRGVARLRVISSRRRCH